MNDAVPTSERATTLREPSQKLAVRRPSMSVFESNVVVASTGSTSNADQPIISIIKDWQTLESGALAIIAALIGGYFISRQVRQTEKHETDRRARRLKAIRSTLPLLLSQLSRWADQIAESLIKAHNAVAGGTSYPIPTLPLPDGVLSGIERFVESSNEDGAESMSNLLADLQIFLARLAELSTPKTASLASIEGHIVGLGTVAAHVDELYDYGRRRSEVIPTLPTWEKVRAALQIRHIFPDNYPKVFELIARREAEGKVASYILQPNRM